MGVAASDAAPRAARPGRPVRLLWNASTLCRLVPCLLHRESPDPDALVLVHGVWNYFV